MCDSPKATMKTCDMHVLIDCVPRFCLSLFFASQWTLIQKQQWWMLHMQPRRKLKCKKHKHWHSQVTRARASDILAFYLHMCTQAAAARATLFTYMSSMYFNKSRVTICDWAEVKPAETLLPLLMRRYDDIAMSSMVASSWKEDVLMRLVRFPENENHFKMSLHVQCRHMLSL